MNITTISIIALSNKANELAASEVLTETNSGTYGCVEACKACGSGDPRHADYRVFTRVGDGRERREGCDADEAPGYARRFRQELTDAKRALLDLRQQIALQRSRAM